MEQDISYTPLTHSPRRAIVSPTDGPTDAAKGGVGTENVMKDKGELLNTEIQMNESIQSDTQVIDDDEGVDNRENRIGSDGTNGVSTTKEVVDPQIASTSNQGVGVDNTARVPFRFKEIRPATTATTTTSSALLQESPQGLEKQGETKKGEQEKGEDAEVGSSSSKEMTKQQRRKLRVLKNRESAMRSLQKKAAESKRLVADDKEARNKLLGLCEESNGNVQLLRRLEVYSDEQGMTDNEEQTKLGKVRDDLLKRVEKELDAARTFLLEPVQGG